MKRIVITTLALALFSFAGLQAQINETVKKETTVKKVTVKDTNVETIVDEEVEEKRSVINVEGTEQTNQDSEEVVVTDKVSKSVKVEDKKVNLENEKDLEKLRTEEAKRIDGQQRGVPIQSDDQVKPKPQVTTKAKKEGDDK